MELITRTPPRHAAGTVLALILILIALSAERAAASASPSRNSPLYRHIQASKLATS
jgi:hypothetical protein